MENMHTDVREYTQDASYNSLTEPFWRHCMLLSKDVPTFQDSILLVATVLLSLPWLYHWHRQHPFCYNSSIGHRSKYFHLKEKQQSPHHFDSFNPSTTMSDWLLISPYSTTLKSNLKVIRITKMITNLWCSWFSYKFSFSVPNKGIKNTMENVDTDVRVWRVTLSKIYSCRLLSLLWLTDSYLWIITREHFFLKLSLQ